MPNIYDKTCESEKSNTGDASVAQIMLVSEGEGSGMRDDEQGCTGT